MFKFNRKLIAKTKSELVESINEKNTYGKLKLIKLNAEEIYQGICALMVCVKCSEETLISVKSIYGSKSSLNKHCLNCENNTPISSRLYQDKEFFDAESLITHVNTSSLANETIQITRAEDFYKKGILSKRGASKGTYLYKVWCKCSVCNREFAKPLSEIDSGNYDCFMCENEWKKEVQDSLESSLSGEEFIEELTPPNFTFLRYKSETFNYENKDTAGMPTEEPMPVSSKGYNRYERRHSHKNGWFGSQTIVEYSCDDCGFTSFSIAEWIIRKNLLNKSTSCAKCEGITLTCSEREEELKNKHPDLHLIEWKGYLGAILKPEDTRKYPSVNDHVVMACSKKHTYELPIHKVRKEDHECPVCIGPNWTISKLLREAKTTPDILYNKRYLYWIKFTHLTKHYDFWKIGLSNTQNLTLRYPKYRLAKDSVAIEIIESIPCTNYEAIRTERFILMAYHESLQNEQLTLKRSAGGTECFKINILEQSNLKEMIKEALEQELIVHGASINIDFDPEREQFEKS
jgi:hypothetical protein